jgi:hypothetical protein
MCFIVGCISADFIFRRDMFEAEESVVDIAVGASRISLS